MKKIIGVILLGISSLFGATKSIEQWGVTFYFETARPSGMFANGDYWVLGPVTIDSITPHYANGHHGYEVNPDCISAQHLDRRWESFEEPKEKFPIKLDSGSIIKVISKEPLDSTNFRPKIKDAVVLTVVPAGIDTSVLKKKFRPPYVGVKKYYYDISSIRSELLPQLEGVSSIPDASALYNQVRHVQMTHKKWKEQDEHPENALPYYGADVCRRNGDAILRLFINDNHPDKQNLLIAVLQGGIDYFHFFINGNDWVSNASGEQPGNFLPMVFAAYMLNDKQMVDTIKKYTPISYEERSTYFNKEGRAMWGSYLEHSGKIAVYWKVLGGAEGGKTYRDPYGLIDGGGSPGGLYQHCCSSMQFKSIAIILHLLPALQEIYQPKAMLAYVDRWVEFGAWTQPDSCAPAKGTYGVDFGPHPDSSGGCICDKDPSDGIGRAPAVHATNKNTGLYQSAFANQMWDKYRKSGAIPGVSVPQKIRLLKNSNNK